MDFFDVFTTANINLLMSGLKVTFEVAFKSIIFSFLLGTMIGLLRYSRVPILSSFFNVWVETVKNLPILLLIFLTFFVVPDFLQFDFSKKQSVIIALVLFESALLSEIIRKGLHSIPRGQIEAARSTGLTYVQWLRFISLPQALRGMVSPIANQFITIIKDSSLGMIIALDELMHNAQIIYNQEISYVFPILFFVAFLYFIMNYSLALLSRIVEHRLQH